MAAALRVLKVLDQLAQRECGLKAKFGPKQCPVASKLADRFRLVALGQVQLDEGGMRAFSERLRSHGRTGGVDGFTPAADGCEAASERF
jgi:hypothetical protein